MAAQPQKLNSTDDETSDPQDPLVAVATDDGAVRIHVAEPGGTGLPYTKTAGRSDARALHVVWKPDGTAVFAGFSDGCISCFDVASGTETLRITATTKTSGDPACIWSLAVLPGGELASGSSRGAVQVFETQFGTQQSSCREHKADVTCLAVSPSGRGLFAAGVDPSLVLLTRNKADVAKPKGAPAALPRFQFSDRRRPHSHDIRAMAVVTPPRRVGPNQPEGDARLDATGRQPGRKLIKGQEASAAAATVPLGQTPSWLITGGNDAQLLVHSAEGFTSLYSARVTGAPCAPLVGMAGHGQFVAATHEGLGVWQCARASAEHRKGTSLQNEGDLVLPEAPPRLLARLPSTPEARAISVAISPCGHFVACSSTEQTTLFVLAPDAGGAGAGREAAVEALAAVRTRRPLPAACALCFVQLGDDGSAEKAVEGPKECLLLLGCLDARLLCLHVDVACDGALPQPTEVKLPEEEKLRRSAALNAVSQNLASTQAQLPFSHIKTSPGGSTTAVVTPHAVHVLTRSATDAAAGSQLSPQGKLALPLDPLTRPITALTVSSRRLLAVSTPDEVLELYDCTTLLPLQWLANDTGLQSKLQQLSGNVHSLSFRPGAASDALGSLILCSHTRLCHICLDSVKAGVPLTGVGIAKPMRAKAKPVFMGDRAGAAVRVIDARGVVLGAGWVSRESFLLIQGSWDAATEQLPAPLLLKVYGA